MKIISLAILLFVFTLCTAQEKENTSFFKGWKVSNVGIRYQYTDQYLPGLDYQGIVAFANNEAASEVAMEDFENYGAYEFVSESVGAYIGVSKPFSDHFSHYVEFGADYHVASEFLVDYVSTSSSTSYETIGWCILQDGLNFHIKYGLSYDWKFIQARLGPTLTYGTSFNDELILLQDSFQPNAFDAENLGSIASTRSWVAYVDTQVIFGVHKQWNIVFQGKWGTGNVNGLDERVERSSVFGAGVEYQFN